MIILCTYPCQEKKYKFNFEVYIGAQLGSFPWGSLFYVGRINLLYQLERKQPLPADPSVLFKQIAFKLARILNTLYRYHTVARTLQNNTRIIIRFAFSLCTHATFFLPFIALFIIPNIFFSVRVCAYLFLLDLPFKQP